MSGPRKPIIVRQCLYCGSSFLVSRSKPHKVYCTHDCYGKARKGVPLSERVDKVCKGCGKIFSVLPKEQRRLYCTQNCYTSSKKGKPILPIIERVCAGCGVIFRVSRRKPGKKYCSSKCFRDAVVVGHKVSAATKAKMSVISKRLGVLKRLHKDPEFQRKRIRGLHAKPNFPEKELDKLLTEFFPGHYKFTGDGSFLVDGLNPDFTNVNGQKKLIEVFGESFHDPKKSLKKVPYRATVVGRTKVFSKYGYSLLIVWSKEIHKGGEEGRVRLIKKLKDFHENSSH